MPTKASETNKSKRYSIDGKTFTWITDEGDRIVLPMRIKLKVVRALADRTMDVSAMFDIIDAIAPGQSEVLDEMDVNDFSACFTAWQAEYQALTGATLGE